MPDKSSTVVSYAAGASLAAVALIYVFGPNFTLDSEPGGSKKKTIVGLRNQANDCFINSVLQALAGLGELRMYLIRETHRRNIEDPAVYANLVQPEGEGSRAEVALWKLQGLQAGLVTNGLKDMMDALNERPIAKKAISPFQFVKVLEGAFKQRISRQQQDAQEFLQIVAERLKDEYHAGQRARSAARRNGMMATLAAVELERENGTQEENAEAQQSEAGTQSSQVAESPNGLDSTTTTTTTTTTTDFPTRTSTTRDPSATMPHLDLPPELEEGFPMEGKWESHIECLTCRYKTKPREETFCTMTVAVPQVASTSLNACFDGIFKTEFITDFKCEMCRIVQAKTNLEAEMVKSTSEDYKQRAQEDVAKLQHAMETDPENPPADVDLGDIRYAPRRRIARTTKMSIFPKVLALHLSRSIYGVGQATQKNSAKVSFPEELSLGGLADQRRYKLLGLVTHRGGHNSGHYEAFRRQHLPAPYHNANTFQQSEVYSKTPTPISTPEIAARKLDSPSISTPDLLSPPSMSSTPSLESFAAQPESAATPPRSVPQDSSHRPGSRHRGRDSETSSLRSMMDQSRSALSKKLSSPKLKSSSSGAGVGAGTDTLKPSPRHVSNNNNSNNGLRSNLGVTSKPMRKKKVADKWWRVSDEKVREAKTSEVLGMQREVYLLFYELDKTQ